MLTLTDFIYEIMLCILFLMYRFISMVVGKCGVCSAASINEHFCFSVRLSLKHSRKIFGYTEAYSAAGEIGFSWWLVEHYSAYHIDCPDGCVSGEPARGG